MLVQLGRRGFRYPNLEKHLVQSSLGFKPWSVITIIGHDDGNLFEVGKEEKKKNESANSDVSMNSFLVGSKFFYEPITLCLLMA
jgi:hypothetical protein